MFLEQPPHQRIPDQEHTSSVPLHATDRIDANPMCSSVCMVVTMFVHTISGNAMNQIYIHLFSIENQMCS